MSFHISTYSSSGLGLFVKFESEKSEDTIFKNEEEAVKHLRIRSLPLQGDDCSKIAQGEHVLAAHKSQFKIRLFDAEVQKVQFHSLNSIDANSGTHFFFVYSNLSSHVP